MALGWQSKAPHQAASRPERDAQSPPQSLADSAAWSPAAASRSARKPHRTPSGLSTVGSAQSDDSKWFWRGVSPRMRTFEEGSPKTGAFRRGTCRWLMMRKFTFALVAPSRNNPETSIHTLSFYSSHVDQSHNQDSAEQKTRSHGRGGQHGALFFSAVSLVHLDATTFSRSQFGTAHKPLGFALTCVRFDCSSVAVTRSSR